MDLPEKYNYVEMHPQLEKALNTLRYTDENMCIIGPGGTGKSLFIKLCVDKEIYNRPTIVCTPTGISAVNVSTEDIQAVTIHSLFRLPPLSIIPADRLITYSDLFPVFRSLDTLIIDEISMVNSDLLTKIVHLLDLYRGNMPKVRLILLGDPSQLSPVVRTMDEQEFLNDTYGGRFFFQSPVFDSMQVLHFDKIYRQQDIEFIDVLNRMRMGQETLDDLIYINKRVMPVEEFNHKNFMYIALTNRTVNAINEDRLNETVGKTRLYRGQNTGFEANELPSPEIMKLTVGAQVMITVNNKAEGYYNGMIATVTEVHADYIVVQTEEGGVHVIKPYRWEKYSFTYSKEEATIFANVSGVYTQIPVKLAYALTAHKTQGLTLDKVYLDMENGSFASGQLYTALSRVTTYEGLGLARRIKSSDNKISPSIKRFYRRMENE